MRLRTQAPWRSLLGKIRRDTADNMPPLSSSVNARANGANILGSGKAASVSGTRNLRTRAGRPSRGRDDLRTNIAWDWQRERPQAQGRFDARGGNESRRRDMASPAAEEKEGWPMAAQAQERIPLPSHVSEITSTANPLVKYCVRLRQSASFRLSTRRVLVAGTVPLREICGHLSEAQASHAPTSRSSPPTGLLEASAPLELLFTLEDPQASLSGRNGDLAQAARRVVRVSGSVMSKLSGVESLGSSHVAAILPLPPSFLSFAPIPAPSASPLPPPSLSRGPEDDTTSSPHALFSSWLPGPPKRILVLDGVQDPGNVGTLIRTALAFNWEAVFLLTGCCDPFNEKALRASRGGAFRLPLASGEWQDCQALATHFGMNVFAAAPASAGPHHPQRPSLLPSATADLGGPAPLPSTGTVAVDQAGAPQADPGKGLEVGDGSLAPSEVQALLSRPLCLVLGSEGQGLSPSVSAAATPLSIRMPGDMESLNVGIAGGILMYLLALE